MRQLLAKNRAADRVPVDALILFSNPQAQLTITDPTIPVLTGEDVK